MSYFTAALARTDDDYEPLDIDIHDAETLEDLTDLLRTSAGDDAEVIAVIEREDEWFAIVRVTDVDDVKVFISSLEAAQDSPYAEWFVDYLDSQPDEYELEPDDDFDYDTSDDDDDDESVMLGAGEGEEWGGDADIFADAGVLAQELVDQIEEHAADPARVVAHIGEKVGFADQLEAAR